MIFSSRCGRSSAIALLNRRWLVLWIILLGAAFRINGLDRDSRLHADEALFASFARQMVLAGDWNLYTEPIDKPPTTFALVGGSLAFVGQTEFAVRLPNVWASVLSLAVVYRLAKTLSNELAAVITVLLVATAPLDIAYAPTAFQDPPMILFVLLGVLLLLRQRWAWGGFWLGLAFCMKPTAIYLFPLAIGLIILHQAQVAWRNWGQSIVAALFPIGLLVLWDETRLAQSLFTLGSHNNNPNRLIRSDEVLPRADQWLQDLALFAPTATVALLLVGLGLVWLVISARQRYPGGVVSWWIVSYGVAYLGWHWLIAFPIYDRYLLPLLPFGLMVVGSGVAWLYEHWQRLTQLLIVGGLIGAWQPATTAIHLTDPPVGQQVDVVSQLLKTDYPGQIVYDYSLGWQLRWYLGQRPPVQVVFFPAPEQLAQHMQHDDGIRYLIAPDRSNAEPWIALLAANGIQSRTIYDHNDVVLIEVRPPIVAH